MRPRKKIAVLGATPEEEPALGIVLESRGYDVRICMSESAAMRIESPAVFVVLGLSAAERVRVESRLWLQHREATVVMESHGMNLSPAWMACLLERVRIAAIRKRGPKPFHRLAKQSASGEMQRVTRTRVRVA